MKKFVASFAAAALVVSPAFAGSMQTSDTGDTGAAPVANPNEVVCRRVANTGWRLAASRVCKTRAEWAALSRRQGQDLDNHNSYQGRSRCLNCGQ